MQQSSTDRITAPHAALRRVRRRRLVLLWSFTVLLLAMQAAAALYSRRTLLRGEPQQSAPALRASLTAGAAGAERPGSGTGRAARLAADASLPADGAAGDQGTGPGDSGSGDSGPAVATQADSGVADSSLADRGVERSAPRSRVRARRRRPRAGRRKPSRAARPGAGKRLPRPRAKADPPADDVRVPVGMKGQASLGSTIFRMGCGLCHGRTARAIHPGVRSPRGWVRFFARGSHGRYKPLRSNFTRTELSHVKAYLVRAARISVGGGR